MTRYRTIVADPPWDHSDGTGVNFGEGRNITHLPYPTMSVDAIKTLPVRDLAAVDVSGQRRDKSIPRDGCVLYLWATTRYLEAAHGVARALAQMDDDVAAFDALPEDIKRQTEPIWPRDGVGGSITPSDEITITPAMQKLNTLLGGWPVGGSITPADQEDTDE